MKKLSNVRIGLYARVSSDRQAEANTIASQLAALRRRVAADGGHVDPEFRFVDDGYSGGTLLRPALERLRDIAAQGALDRLYVLAPDRLARNYAYQFLLLDEFRRAGVEVIFLNHALGRSAEDDLLLQVQGVIAEYERAKISERSRRGKLHAARTGQVSVLCGAPYGYRFIGRSQGGGQARYDIVLEQARVVQQIFAWVARERVSLREVCRRLEQRGQPSPTGQARWNSSTVGYVLKNPAYEGNAGFGKSRVIARQPRLRPRRGKSEVPRRPYSVTRQDTHPEFVPVPALVSREDFAAAAEQLAENRQRHRQRRAGARYLLQGLVVCGQCGYAWYGLPGGRSRRQPTGRTSYRCGGRQIAGVEAEARCRQRQINGARLEEAVWQDVCALLKHPQKIAEEYQRRLHDKPGTSAARGIEPLTRVIDQVKRSIARLIDLYSDGMLEKHELEPRLQAAKERLGRLEAEAQSVAAQQAERAELRLALTRLQAFANQVKAGLKSADWARRREVIRAVVKRVEVSDQAVRIVYRVAPVPFVERPLGGALQDCPKSRESFQAIIPIFDRRILRIFFLRKDSRPLFPFISAKEKWSKNC
jgi:site-specific DNA recombinase